MKKINLTTSLFLILLTGAFTWQSCVRDELDFENISTTIDYNPQLHAPIIRGSLTIADIYDAQDEDSVLVIKGDSIILYIRQDTVATYNIADFVEIPDQGSQHYHIASPPADLIFPDLSTYTLVQNDSFHIELEHNMRMDSIFTNTGTLVMEVSSNFSSVGVLRITSPSLYINNEIFDTIIQFSRPSGDYFRIHNIPLTNAKIVVNNTNPDYPKLEVNFTIIQVVQAGDTIKANSFTNIDFRIIDLEDFERAFGYAGDTSFVHDTLMEVDLGEVLDGLTGEFAITNMKIKGYFDDGDSVILQPGMQNILISQDYLYPEITSSMSFDRSNIWNIDQLLVFTPPQSIGYQVNIFANPDGDEDVQNYMLGDSKLLLGLEIEVPLEFRADLQFRDTFKLNVEDAEEAQYIEFANLHYRFRNEFPVDIGVKLVLLDSTDNDRVLDTIFLNNSGNQLLLNAAPVDINGLTIRDQVIEVPGAMELNQDQINYFFNVANKAIVIGELKAENPQDAVYGSVKILSDYKLDFKFNIEARIHYQGSPD
jgi:hypothetical protein